MKNGYFLQSWQYQECRNKLIDNPTEIRHFFNTNKTLVKSWLCTELNEPPKSCKMQPL